MNKSTHSHRQAIPLFPEEQLDESPRSRQSIVNQTRSRISYNAASRFAGRTLGGLISLVALHLAANYFGPSGWGPIAGALAFIGLLTSLADFGVGSILSRDLVTSNSPRELLASGLAAALGLSMAATIVAGIGGGIAFAGLPVTRSLVFVLLPTIPATAVFAALSAVLIAESRNDVRAIFDVVSSLLPLAGVLVLVSLRSGPEGYAALVSATSVVMVFVGLLAATRYVNPDFRAVAKRTFGVLRDALPLGLSQLTGVIYLRIDTLLVVAFLSASQVGYYAVDTRVAAFFAATAGILTVAATPAFLRKDLAGWRQLTSRLVRLLAAGGLVVVLIGIFLPHLILEIVAGGRFGPAAAALRFLLVATGLGFVAACFGTVIYLTGNQRWLWRIGIVVLVVNVVANLIAIPRWGIEGAGGAFVLSEIVQLLLGGLVAYRIGLAEATKP